MNSNGSLYYVCFQVYDGEMYCLFKAIMNCAKKEKAPVYVNRCFVIFQVR